MAYQLYSSNSYKIDTAIINLSEGNYTCSNVVNQHPSLPFIAILCSNTNDVLICYLSPNGMTQKIIKAKQHKSNIKYSYRYVMVR